MGYVEVSMHEDFLSVQEYEMVSRDEFLQQMKDWFEDPTLDLRPDIGFKKRKFENFNW